MRRQRPALPAARWLLAVLLCMNGQSTLAGNQKEEALADAVRLTLSRAISDARPPQLEFSSYEDRDAWRQWSALMSTRLQSRMPDAMVRSEFLQTVWYEARRAGLEPALVLGL
ncbi:MAG: hypothetical protein RL369_1904, partial [Pseudomonadota bacterium]